jgi:hypothetical protein
VHPACSGKRHRPRARIKAAHTAAEDEAAKVAEHGGDRRSEDQGDNITSNSDRGTSRSYVVGRLKREAAKAEGVDPLFVKPEHAKAAELLLQVMACEISANAAAHEMGWRKPRTAYQDLCAAWRRASEDERAAFEDHIAACDLTGFG